MPELLGGSSLKRRGSFRVLFVHGGHGSGSRIVPLRGVRGGDLRSL